VPLSEAIFRQVGRAIVEGRLQPNERLIEARLCRAFGCSRSPLREAIRMLAAEGLVTLSPRRGARVAELTQKTVSDVFAVRLLLEGLAARLAAEHRSDADVAELHELNRKMRMAVRAGDSATFFKMNTSFHRAIARIGRNAYLATLQESAADRSLLPLFLFLSDFRHFGDAVSAHDQIIRAIEEGDAAGAARSMHRHLEAIHLEAERLVRERSTAGESMGG
jgi:DNA-binding GntR family transcriptional regulator